MSEHMNTNPVYQAAKIAIWSAVLLGWTVSLLRPIPPAAVAVVGGPERSFWFAKCLHVSVYVLLAVGASFLPGSVKIRRWLLLVLVLHGGLTEFLQQFVHRGASWRDVGLDTLGVAIGVALTWKRWFGTSSQCGSGGDRSRHGGDRGSRRINPGELPKKEMQHHGAGQDENAAHL
jgi:VanZ family protein